MTEFSAAATLKVPDDEIRDARSQIEEGLEDIPVGVSAGSGSAAAAQTTDVADDTADLVSLADERNEILEDILDELEEQSGGGGFDLPFPRPRGSPTKTGGSGQSPLILPLPGPEGDPRNGPTQLPTPTQPPVRLPGPTGQPAPRETPDRRPRPFPDLPLPIPDAPPAPGPSGPTFDPNSDTPPPDILTRPGPQQAPSDSSGGPSVLDVIGGIGQGALVTALGKTASQIGSVGSSAAGSVSSPGVGFPAPINPDTIRAVSERTGLPIPSFGPGGQQQQPRALQARQATITTSQSASVPGQSLDRSGDATGTAGRGNATSSPQRQQVDVNVEVQPQKPKQSVIDDIKRQIDRELGKDFNLGLGVL